MAETSAVWKETQRAGMRAVRSAASRAAYWADAKVETMAVSWAEWMASSMAAARVAVSAVLWAALTADWSGCE